MNEPSATRNRDQRSLEQENHDPDQHPCLLDDLSDSMIRVRADGTRTHINDAHCRLLGYTAEELIGGNIFEAMPEDAVARVRAAFASLSPEHESSQLYEHRVYTRDGREVWMQWRDRGIFDAAGRLVEVQCVGRDISAQKRMEDDLRRSEARYRDLVEGSIQGILVHRGGEILFANQALADILGYDSPEQMRELGLTAAKVVAPYEKERVMANIAARLRGEDPPSNYELDVIRRDGSIATLQNVVRVTNWDGDVALQATLIDVTERRQAREELERHRNHLEELVAQRTAALEYANRELESFSYSVSHDLRAPLRAIDGFSGILQEEYGSQLDETAHDYLRRVREGACRMGDLIDDLLQLARVAQQKLVVRTVDLAELAHTVIEQLRVTEPHRTVQFECSGDLRVRGDEKLYRVVMQNLLDNAWKYTRRQAHAAIEVGAQGGGSGERLLYVRDNGVGFDMRYAHKLFEPFQRLHTNTDYEGSGIGLATVGRIVQRHGGRIWAESQPGRGTVVRLSLPAR